MHGHESFSLDSASKRFKAGRSHPHHGCFAMLWSSYYEQNIVVADKELHLWIDTSNITSQWGHCTVGGPEQCPQNNGLFPAGTGQWGCQGVSEELVFSSPACGCSSMLSCRVSLGTQQMQPCTAVASPFACVPHTQHREPLWLPWLFWLSKFSLDTNLGWVQSGCSKGSRWAWIPLLSVLHSQTL